MDVVTGLTSVGVLTVCLGLYKVANGQLAKKVSRDACHTAQEGIHRRIDDFQAHIDNRIDDLKDTINGKTKT